MTATTPPSFGPAHRSILLLLAVFITCFTGLAETAYEPGKSYFGRSNYVEYIAGNMPLMNRAASKANTYQLNYCK